MNNRSIKILRGLTNLDPKSSDITLDDGQLFFSKRNNQLYVGDDNKALKDLEGTQIGLPLIYDGNTLNVKSNLSVNCTDSAVPSDIETAITLNGGKTHHNNTIISGPGNESKAPGQFIVGQYASSNVEDLFVVGSGLDFQNKRSAFKVTQDAIVVGSAETPISSYLTTVKIKGTDDLTGEETDKVDVIRTLVMFKRLSTLGDFLVTAHGYQNYRIAGITSSTEDKLVLVPNDPTYANVKGIDDSAFSGHQYLNEIELTDKITYVGGYCFSNSSLKKINLPKSVEKIGYKAFTNSKLEEVNINFNLTQHSLFYDCKNLKKVTFGSDCKITTLPPGTFYGCTSLDAVSLPSTVTNIGYSAFYGASNLSHIDLSKIQNVAYSAFFKCSNLTSAIFNEELSLSNRCFAESGLKYVKLPSGKVDLTQLRIFNMCNQLEAIKFINTTSPVSGNIGPYMFDKCEKLSSIMLPGGVTKISDWAFSDCSALTTIYLPKSIDITDRYAMGNLTESTEATATAEEKGDNARVFRGCSNLTIYLEDGLKDNGEANYTDIAWPNNENDWYWNPSLCQVVISESIPQYYQIEVEGDTKAVIKGFQNIKIGDKGNIRLPSLQRLKDYDADADTFESCLTLTVAEQAFLGSNPLDPSNSATDYSTYLKSIIIPEDYSEIGFGAFANLTNLRDIIIEPVTTQGKQEALKISGNAFARCSNLQSILSARPITLSSEDGLDVFYNCSNLKSIDLDITNDINNDIWDAFHNAESDGYEGFFVNCNNLTFARLNIEVLPENMFIGCANLETLILGDKLKYLQNGFSTGCSKLKEIIFEGTLESWKDATKTFYDNTDIRLICIDGIKENIKISED